MPTSPLLTRGAVLIALRSAIPDAEWLLRQIESQDGWFRFPPFLIETIANLKLGNYPLLYTCEPAITGIFLRGFLGEEEIKALALEVESMGLEERATAFGEIAADLNSSFENIEIPKTPEQRRVAKELFESLSPEEQAQSIKATQHFFLSFFATFYQNLSTMVHGEKLTSLVAQAQAGDDHAFVKAVQIDRRILTTLPYFQQRYATAHDEADSNFFDLLAYRQKSAPYRGKIRHKSLWLAFSMLEQAGLLDSLSHREILEMCDEAGVGGYENRIQSVKHLSSRLQEYREFQRRGIASTT